MRRSNAVRHRRLDHRAMAGRLSCGRPARGAAGRPCRRAGRARDNAWILRVDGQALARQLDELARLLAAADGTCRACRCMACPTRSGQHRRRGLADHRRLPAFAYTPDEDAGVVRRLRAAGAILIGKTNLDQFATGLVGTRSPHGAVANAFRPEYISGGSSSGSASVVARGLAAFSLGTDTAGSGRAGGLQQHRRTQAHARLAQRRRRGAGLPHAGLRVGVRPDGRRRLARGRHRRRLRRARSLLRPCRPAPSLPARPRFAVPDKLEFHGDAEAEAAFDAALLEVRATGAELRTVDFSPYAELAALLYQGPWVAERFAAVEALWREQPARSTRWCAASSKRPGASALDAFQAEYRRALARVIQQSLADVDALLVPTAPSIYTIAQLREDPLALNSRLGRYTTSPIWPTCARWPCRRVCAATACPPASPCWAWPGRTMRWPNSAGAGRRAWACRWAPPASRCPPRRRRVIRRRACCAWPWWARTSAACR